LYFGGRGVAQDNHKAAKWASASARQGNFLAQRLLANLYLMDVEDLPVQPREIIHFLHESADQGHSTSNYLLGRMYELGKGVDRNYKWAAELYRKAAKGGIMRADVAL